MRSLERQIAKVCRKAVKEHAKLKRIQAVVSSETLENYLGVRKFRYGLAEQQDQIGQVTGLPGPRSAASCLPSRRPWYPARAS